MAVTDEDTPALVPFHTQQVAIILEDKVVQTHRFWADALVNLFGLIYALHLQYPAKLKGFFEFMQIVLLHLDNGRNQLKSKLVTEK